MKTKPDNPYASPVSPPGGQSSPAVNSSRRLASALLYSFQSWLGLAVTLLLVTEMFDRLQFIPVVSTSIMFGFFCLATSPVGVAMSIWVWREPDSKWPSWVANLLGFAPFALAVFGFVFGVF